jgi:hypothetical protein
LQNWLFKEPREWNGHFLRCSQYLVEMKNSSSQSGLKDKPLNTKRKYSMGGWGGGGGTTEAPPAPAQASSKYTFSAQIMTKNNQDAAK